MTTQTTVDYKKFHDVLYRYGVNFQYPIDTEKFIKEISQCLIETKIYLSPNLSETNSYCSNENSGYTFAPVLCSYKF
jgi:hypothetical protein